MKKLNIKELRVGNYVDAEVGLPGLQFHELLAKDFNYINDESVSVYGIVLTEEILLKFGFYCLNKEKQNNYFLSPINIYVNNGKLQHSGYDREIKYVHELQNIYYGLTGKELIFNNN